MGAEREERREGESRTLGVELDNRTKRKSERKEDRLCPSNTDCTSSGKESLFLLKRERERERKKISFRGNKTGSSSRTYLLRQRHTQSTQVNSREEACKPQIIFRTHLSLSLSPCFSIFRPIALRCTLKHLN